MDAPTAQNRLEIEVQDFGPIVHAKLDLRPMTVFIGPSNTGKSYLAILIYALHRFFGESRALDGALDEILTRPFWELMRRYATRSDVPLTALDRVIEDISDVVASGEEANIKLPEEIAKWLGNELNEWGNGIDRELLRCFGASRASALVRKGREIRRGKVTITPPVAEGNTASEQVFIFGADQSTFRPSVQRDILISSDEVSNNHLWLALNSLRGLPDQDRSAFLPVARAELLAYLVSRVTEYLVGDLRLPAFYLPADRTGVMHAHSAIVSAMLANASMAALEPSARTSLLSGVLTDFLRRLIEIGSPELHRQRARYPVGKPDAATGMERHILQGAIGVESSQLINYPNFTYRPDGWKEDLPLMHASSMVSELAPVVLYLRHLVQPGNVLIIEEPESHLHPAAQVEFTRQLAKLVQSGYRVIITTHSEWILEELANILRRSQLSSDDLGAVSESDAALTEDQVGVWSFEPTRRPKGARVVEAKREPSGLYDTGFDDVAIALHNDWANISNRIGETE